MKLKIRFWNKFDIAFLSLAAVGFLAFQAYIRTDHYRAQELVDEWVQKNGAANVGQKPSMLARLGLARKPPRQDGMEVLRDLKAVADEAAPLLAQHLGGRDSGGMCALAMGRLGKASRPYLIAGLRSPDRKVREEAAYALGGLRREALPVAPEMLRALHDEDGIIRQSMARSLVRIDLETATAEALPVILADLHDPNVAVVLYATVSLAEIGPVNDASRAAIAEVQHGRWKQTFATVAEARNRP